MEFLWLMPGSRIDPVRHKSQKEKLRPPFARSCSRQISERLSIRPSFLSLETAGARSSEHPRVSCTASQRARRKPQRSVRGSWFSAMKALDNPSSRARRLPSPCGRAGRLLSARRAVDFPSVRNALRGRARLQSENARLKSTARAIDPLLALISCAHSGPRVAEGAAGPKDGRSSNCRHWSPITRSPFVSAPGYNSTPAPSSSAGMPRPIDERVQKARGPLRATKPRG
jgi:hypothetical protein